MKALHGGRSYEFQKDYHLNKSIGAPEFDKGQPGRIDLARMFVETMLVKDLPDRPLKIVELGCGAGDVTGPYSLGNTLVTVRGPIDTTGIEVIGVDFKKEALEACGHRYPDMVFLLSPVEELVPFDCDLLVMTEFLEHLADPWAVVNNWMPHARWALIGHPLNEPDPPYEHGHSFSYDLGDFYAWFEKTNFHVWEHVIFPMGPYPEMIMGHGSRK